MDLQSHTLDQVNSAKETINYYIRQYSVVYSHVD